MNLRWTGRVTGGGLQFNCRWTGGGQGERRSLEVTALQKKKKKNSSSTNCSGLQVD